MHPVSPKLRRVGSVCATEILIDTDSAHLGLFLSSSRGPAGAEESQKRHDVVIRAGK